MPDEGNRELFLPWHEPLPLSKTAYECAWRFMGKLFSGRGFATTLTAGICFGSALVVIAGSGIAAWRVEQLRVGDNAAPLMVGINAAPRGGWIIATVSALIVAGSSRAA
jgi:hypothetical protein